MIPGTGINKTNKQTQLIKRSAGDVTFFISLNIVWRTFNVAIDTEQMSELICLPVYTNRVAGCPGELKRRRQGPPLKEYHIPRTLQYVHYHFAFKQL